MYSIKNFSRHRARIELIVLAMVLAAMAACAKPPEATIDPASVNISGMWNYQRLTPTANGQAFSISHFHVGLADDGQTVILQHCTRNKNMTFVRNKDVLVNDQNQQLKIIDENTIESLSVPDLWQLTKIKPTVDHFHNAGDFTLQSNALPLLEVSEGVCVQRTVIEGSNKLIINLSAPFEESYINVELEVDNIYDTRNNITRMSLYSPAFQNYYGSRELEILEGQATVVTLTHEKLLMSFDVTQKLFNTFPGDRLQGSINVRF